MENVELIIQLAKLVGGALIIWELNEIRKEAKGREGIPGCVLANSGKPWAQTLSDQGQRGLTRPAKFMEKGAFK